MRPVVSPRGSHLLITIATNVTEYSDAINPNLCNICQICIIKALNVICFDRKQSTWTSVLKCISYPLRKIPAPDMNKIHSHI